MRVNCHFCIETLKEALARLGYCNIGVKKSCFECRRHEYHLTVRDKGKRGITIQMHEDVPSFLPPFHRAKRESKSLETEMDKIFEAYKRTRGKMYEGAARNRK